MPALRIAARASSPAYFAFVMATGIVSIEAHLLGLMRIAVALFRINVAVFVVVAAFTGVRAACFARELWLDMADHHRGPAFFASVAACAVLGSQFVVLDDDYVVAGMLWVVAAVLWVALTYTVFTALAIRRRKPALDEAISGSWLLAVVATQSIAVLATYLTMHRDTPYAPALDFLALCAWLCGAMLYVWIISLMFYRAIFFRIEAREHSPSFWITMGAMAISTLAGSLLLDNAPAVPFLASLAPFIKGFTLLCWATGTWWIPIVVALTVWRHGFARVALRYDALYWSAVFPLGMYAVGSFQMAHALELAFLYPMLPYMGYVALVVWAIVCIGLVQALAHWIVRVVPRRTSSGR